MADNLHCAGSNLLCTENTNTCFDGFDGFDSNVTNDDGEFGVSPSWHHKSNQNHTQNPNFNNGRSCSVMDFTLQTEERVREMVANEREHLPKDDYLKRLRCGDLDLRVRREALDWIWKAHAHFRFGPLCFCLSMNYLDRFLSIYELPKGKTWTVQLLSVACLSLAVKMEETEVPLLIELQVGEPKYVFEAKTIQRMELLVLCTLKWRMHCLTPCSFIDYFLTKINGDQHPSTTYIITRSAQLILCTIQGIDFLEFKPSEIAAAVAISVSGDAHAKDIEKAISCFIIHVEKERVLKCVELIKDLSLMNGSANVSVSSIVPHSPDGVLDAACLSYNKTEAIITVGSCTNSAHNTTTGPDIKEEERRHKTTISTGLKS